MAETVVVKENDDELEPGLDEAKEKKADVYREAMWSLEDKLNELTKGEFFTLTASFQGKVEKFEIAHIGMETYTVKDLQRLVDKYPEILSVVRQCIKLHLDFYDFYLGNGWRNNPDEGKILALSVAFPPKAFSLREWAKK